jgi:hypothetical protein
MRREKRTARLVAYVHPSMQEQLELFVAESSNVISISDYLFELIEKDIAEKESSMRISKQRIGARVGRQ